MKKDATGKIENLKTKRQWKLHQQLGTFAQSTLHDAEVAGQNKAHRCPFCQ
jgi:imidazoleglycerol phosphate dehydratase HisB